MQSESKKSFYERLRDMIQKKNSKEDITYTVGYVFQIADLLREEYEKLMGRYATTDEYLIFIDIAANLISKR